MLSYYITVLRHFNCSKSILEHHVHKEDPVTASTKTTDDLGIEPISHTNTESNFVLHMWQLISTIMNGLIFFFAIRVVDIFTNAPEMTRDMILIFGVLATALVTVAFAWFIRSRSTTLSFVSILFCLCCSGAIVMASESYTTPIAWFLLVPIILLFLAIVKEVDRHWSDRTLRAASSVVLHWFVTMLSISLIMRGF